MVKYCPSCGAEVKLPEIPGEEMEAVGVSGTIEEILKELGKNIKLARAGANRWQVEEDTAKIRISYNSENFFIISDAYLCQMPGDGKMIKPLYQFLLQENYRTKGNVLSCVNQNIVLSSVMYDLDITKETGVETFRNLFQNVKEYKNILKKEYNCGSLLEE
jgi:serine protease Do